MTRFRDDPIPLRLDMDEAAAEWLASTRWQGNHDPWRYGTPIPTHQRDQIRDEACPRCEWCGAPLPESGLCRCAGSLADLEQERLDQADHLRRDGGASRG